MSLDAAALCARLADSLTDGGSRLRSADTWPLVPTLTDAALADAMLRAREMLCAKLGECAADEVDLVLRSRLFLAGDVVTMAGLTGRRHAAAQQRIAAAREIMQVGWTHPQARHAFAIAALHTAAYEMPLMPDLHACPDAIVDRYLTWLLRRPVFHTIGDDAAYVAWLPGMLDWIRARITDPLLRDHRSVLVNSVLHKLDLGMMIYGDVSIRDVLDARARLLETLTAQSETLRGSRRGGPGLRPADRRIRLGFLMRTLMRHPDPLAFCAQFEHFDPARYEIIVYTHDHVDRQCTHDIPLYQRLFRIASTLTTLNGRTVREMIDTIQADDLDIFVYSYAATIGASPTECVVAAPLARVQVAMNSHVPLATGLPSFTHMATVRPPAASRETLLSECREAVAEIPRVLIAYPPVQTHPPLRVITRETLGIPASAPVFYNGGAADKIVPLLAQTWIRALARVPGSVLLLAPFNPGWTGVSAATNLDALLTSVCAQEGVERARVIVLRELSPRDTQQLLDFSTVYLGTFPHGSSTSVTLALQAGVPSVVRRSPWLRGTGDASITASIGLTELIADDADAYTDLVVRLATDPAWHADLCKAIRAALPTAPFLASEEYGRGLQQMFDTLAHESFGYPLTPPASIATEFIHASAVPETVAA